MGIITIISCISTARENRKKTPLASWLLYLGFLAVSGVLIAADSDAFIQHAKQSRDEKINAKLELAESRISAGLNDETTVKLFKKAAWTDEHIEKWKDASRLAHIYSRIGTVYFNMDDFAACREYYAMAADLYEPFGEEANPYLSSMAFKLMMMDAAEDKQEAILQDGEQLAEWNRSKQRKSKETGLMFVFLAQAYYNLGEYEKADGCFQDGTAMIEETADWGSIDNTDKSSAIALSCAYQCAALNAQKRGNQTEADEYSQKYEETVWYHNLSDDDLTLYRDDFHWMKN